jgi:ATP-dependent RNA helicase DeaD
MQTNAHPRPRPVGGLAILKTHRKVANTMSDVFKTDVEFSSLGLRNSVCRGAAEAGFEHPTDIQAVLIPKILEGKDVMGQARTGTGKTAAFTLPLLHMADKTVHPQALILTPTRELAAQVAGEMKELAEQTPIRVACIIGGESYKDQESALGKKPHLLVGTPGRMMDMYQKRKISFDTIKFVVLDEVDRMLDIGFREDIKKLLGKIKNDHQTIFVSATISNEIEQLSRRFMKDDAERITTVAGSLTVELVDQKYLPVEPWDKKRLLLHLLKSEEPETTLVFCRTKDTVRKVTRYLRDNDISAKEIHGDLDQKRRNKVMQSMRDGKLDVLVASDLAARGLDIHHISHVVNYDLPDDPEIYVHRIGRTARAGKQGVAWSFVEPEQGQLLNDIEKLSHAEIEKTEYPDFEPGPVPERVQQERAQQTQKREEAKPLAERIKAPATEGLSEEEKRRMFPGGVVPQSAPKRNLGSKFRKRR